MVLLRSILEHDQALAGEVKALLDGVEDKPATEVLQEISRGLITLLGVNTAEAHCFEILLGEPRSNEELYRLLREVVDDVSASLTAYLRTRIEVGAVREVTSVASAAHAFLGSFLLFLLMNKHLSKQQWQKHTARYADEVLKLLQGGALNDRQGPQP